MPEPPQGADDPHKVWQVFKSVFKNLSSSRAASQELQYLTSLTQIVSEYPQALVATSAWPDIGERGRRREAVTSCSTARLPELKFRRLCPRLKNFSRLSFLFFTNTR